MRRRNSDGCDGQRESVGEKHDGAIVVPCILSAITVKVMVQNWTRCRRAEQEYERNTERRNRAAEERQWSLGVGVAVRHVAGEGLHRDEFVKAPSSNRRA
jgi:hypothetical protein